MKSTLPLFLGLICLFTAVQSHAQAPKFGYINTMELIDMLPESRVADSLLTQYTKDVQAQYDSYLSEYKTKSEEYMKNKDNLSEFVASSKLADLQSLEQRIKEFESNSQKMVSQKRQELLAPVLARAQELVNEIAKENGYRMIFDTSTGSLAYAPESDNVIGLVKKKLGLP